MFKSISWQEFTTAVSVAAACYYAVIIVIFYFRDISAKLKSGQVSTNQAKGREISRPAKNLMGPIATTPPVRKRPIVQSSATADEVEVAENTNVPVVDETHSVPADELLQELGNLFEIMREGKPSEESYVKNIKTLLRQYAHLIGSEEYTRISRTIFEELKTKHDVFLSADVLDELWPKETVKNKNDSNK